MKFYGVTQTMHWRLPTCHLTGTSAVCLAGRQNPLPRPWKRAVTRHGGQSPRKIATTAQAALVVYEVFSNRHDDAIKRLMRAVELDPNSSLARGQLGVALSFGGEPDRSIAALEDAKRLSPRDYLMVIWHAVDAWSHLHAERFADAMACAKQAIEFNPAFPDSHGILAAAAAHLWQM